MTDSKLLDSSAWLSYLYAENIATKSIIESDDSLFISVLSLFEIKLKMLKDKRPLSVILSSLDFVKKRSLVISINEEIAEHAVDISTQHRLAAVDSLIYASALKNNAVLITLDNDFRGLKNVEISE